jgi:hypothetical protein
LIRCPCELGLLWSCFFWGCIGNIDAKGRVEGEFHHMRDFSGSGFTDFGLLELNLYCFSFFCRLEEKGVALPLTCL